MKDISGLICQRVGEGWKDEDEESAARTKHKFEGRKKVADLLMLPRP